MKYIILEDTELAVKVIENLDTKSPVFADLETAKLYVGIRLLSLWQGDIGFIIDFDKVNLEKIKFAIKPLHTVWYGASYDFGCLNMTTDKIDDIMLLVRTAFPEAPNFTLDTICSYLLGSHKLYKDIDKKILQKKGFKLGSLLTEEQYKYAITDVYALSLLWDIDRITSVRELLFYKVDMLNLKYAIEFQQNGAIVDQESTMKELEKIPLKLEKEERYLQGINSKSVPQVKDKLSKLLGYYPQSTSKEALIKLLGEELDKDTKDFIKAVLSNRKTRLRQTNLEKLNTPKLYTRFNPYGTVTGRFSSSAGALPNAINFQNITRDLQYLLTQDTDTTTVIHADYSTAELRAGCSLMGDEQMRKYLLDGVDLHRISAMLADPTILSVNHVIDSQRQKGKAVSFGFIFGMSATTFREYAYTNYGVVFTEEEAKEVKRAYQTTYKGVTRYHKYWWDNYSTEFVVSPLGRRAKPRIGTDAINFSTQASIGETAKLAIHYLVKDNPNKPMLKYLFSQVHDAIYLRVPKELAEEYSILLVKAMLKAWKEIVKQPLFKFKDIPMGVEFEYGSIEPKEVFSIEEL